MNFSNLKVGTRLGLGFGVLVVAMGVVGGLGMLRMGQMNESIERIAQKDWNKARLAMEIDSRARDNAGNAQELRGTSLLKDVFPNGANGIHSIMIHVQNT